MIIQVTAHHHCHCTVSMNGKPKMHNYASMMFFFLALMMSQLVNKDEPYATPYGKLLDIYMNS